MWLRWHGRIRTRSSHGGEEFNLSSGQIKPCLVASVLSPEHSDLKISPYENSGTLLQVWDYIVMITRPSNGNPC